MTKSKITGSDWDTMKSGQSQEIYSLRLITQKMRAESIRLINSIADQAITKPLRQSNLVSFMILFRTKQLMLAIESLLIKGFIQDAAALIQTLIKFRLDMQYISTDPAHADEWIKFKKKDKRPWRVRFLIKKLFPEASDQSSEKASYQYFSFIKHINPMEDQSDFPIRIIENKDVDYEFENCENTADHSLIMKCLMCEGKECHSAFMAAAKDFTDAGFDIKENISEMKKLKDLFESLHTIKQLENKKE